MSEDILVFDADSIAYKAAAANETKTITTQHIEKGVIEHWDNRTAFRAFLKDTPHTEDMYTITDVQEARHSSYGKSLIREMIKGYHNRTGVSKGEIYISGADNFRDSLPLPAEYSVTVGKWAGISTLGGRYKSNRDGNIRPLQLKELRYYMITDLGAVVVNGMEVDDKSSIRAYEGYKNKARIIQVTSDKDALQCTGWLWNPDKSTKPELITGFGELHKEGKTIKGTGRMFLYYQALYGDKVDGYHACDLWKMEQDRLGKTATFGEVTAYNLLKDCKNDKEAWTALHRQYENWYPEPVIYAAWDGIIHTKDSVDIMQLYFNCAFMLRWEGDSVNCREVLSKYGII